MLAALARTGTLVSTINSYYCASACQEFVSDFESPQKEEAEVDLNNLKFSDPRFSLSSFCGNYEHSLEVSHVNASLI